MSLSDKAQSTACRLQEELEKLRAAGPLESSGIEEVTQLKERLEKEKRLTSDLGRAATKLQELLKTTQEQLTKEKDTVKKLQEQLGKAVSTECRHDCSPGLLCLLHAV